MQEPAIQEPTMQETVEGGEEAIKAKATQQEEDQATGNCCVCFSHEHQSSKKKQTSLHFLTHLLKSGLPSQHQP